MSKRHALSPLLRIGERGKVSRLEAVVAQEAIAVCYGWY